MRLTFTYLPYSDTHAFSPLVIDYLNQDERLRTYYAYAPERKGIAEAIAQRQQYPVDRKLLAAVLEDQLSPYPLHDAVKANIKKLENSRTYTVCTAHQPNLMTGYLYFIYKILHAIKLAHELKESFPENDFVPVYYMGSEDNDLEELGTFLYGGRKYVWDAKGQSGAVGRMKTESLKPLLEELFRVLGPPGEHSDELKEMITRAYLSHETMGAATTNLVNDLFGRYGLVVLDPDDRRLKRSFISVMQEDLLQETAHAVVSDQIANLSEHYKVQAHPRSINLFYLTDGLRERIEKKGDKWIVLHTDLQFNREQLLQELDQYTERFSPNVILRGLYQETILPNVVFIGGGAEIAYWLQLRSLFKHFGVFYPCLLLRQSVLWIEAHQESLRVKTGLTLSQIFTPEHELVYRYVCEHSEHDWELDHERAALDSLFAGLKLKAATLDSTLRASAEAALAKMKHQMDTLEKKMYRAEKRKMQDQIARISKLRAHIFPNNSLQERVENFVTWYARLGSAFSDRLFEGIDPLRHQFLVIAEDGGE